MSGVWVVVEEREGRASRISWEAVAAGQKLAALAGQSVNAAIPGAQTESLAAEVADQSAGQGGAGGAPAAGGVHGGRFLAGFAAVF